MGLVVTTVALVIMELATTCSGYCPKLSAFLPDIIWIYGSIILGGVLLGILLGFIFAKFREQYYWLKGGIAGIMLGPIVWFFILKLTIPTSVNVIEFPLVDGLILVSIVYGSAAIIGFIVGSMIGWVYGKLKNRNIQG